ncbi:MAG: hypothetical protein K8W52_05865 [Deltaproteobacteria bacterium]|nr:hypothetical protein [Deltaproteobacteria bacterium]
MKKLTEKKPISLQTETVRVLRDGQIELVVGGRGSATVGGSCRDNTTCCK